jgi:hypothetical protein
MIKQKMQMIEHEEENEGNQNKETIKRAKYIGEARREIEEANYLMIFIDKIEKEDKEELALSSPIQRLDIISLIK